MRAWQIGGRAAAAVERHGRLPRHLRRGVGERRGCGPAPGRPGVPRRAQAGGRRRRAIHRPAGRRWRWCAGRRCARRWPPSWRGAGPGSWRSAAVLAFSLTTPVTMWERSVLSESPGVAALALVVAAGLQVARGADLGAGGVAVRRARPVAGRAGHARGRRPRRRRRRPGRRGRWRRLVDRRRDERPGTRPRRRTRSRPRCPPGGGGGRARPSRLGASPSCWAAVVVGAAHGERQAFPTRNVYEVRMLPYPDRVRWFADHGMPQAEEFLGPDARRPYREPGLPPVVYVPDDDPELGEWLDWVEGDGRAALARFALTHPDVPASREPLRVPERSLQQRPGRPRASTSRSTTRTCRSSTPCWPTGRPRCCSSPGWWGAGRSGGGRPPRRCWRARDRPPGAAARGAWPGTATAWRRRATWSCPPSSSTSGCCSWSSGCCPPRPAPPASGPRRTG